MAITWTNFNNGDTGLVVRNALNTFNTSVALKVSNTEVQLQGIEGAVTTNATDINTIDGVVVSNTADIGELKAPASTKYTPQVVRPPYVEGQLFFDANTRSLMFDGPTEGVDVMLGHNMHTHVINNSGALIEKGMAVRPNGVILGVPNIEKAIATSFSNARILGIVAKDIADGDTGAVMTFGELSGFDTSTFPTGVPLYLSDTVAGTYTIVAPDITSRIGGILIQDNVDGHLFVNIINNKIIPNIFGGMQDQTAGNDVYSLTAVAQDILNYEIEESVVMGVNILAGTIPLLYDGKYRTHVDVTLGFTSTSTTRTVTFELYNQDTSSVRYSFVKNIPRDAVIESFSFSYPFTAIVGDTYKLRVKASVSDDYTISNISFDIASISIVNEY